MRRKFLTNLILLAFLNFLVKPFWVFGIDREVQNVVGAEEYGFYFTIFNFAFIFQILLDLGITNYNNKNIAQNNHLLSKHFSSIIILRFLFAALYMAVIMSVGWIMKYNDRQLFMLSIIGINQFLLGLILYLRSNISALFLFKTDSLISVLDRLLMIGICGVLLWTNVIEGEFQILWFVYAQTAAYILTALVALLLLIKRMEFRGLNWNMPFFYVTLKKSLPYALLILLMSLYNRIDSVLIDKLLPVDGKLQVGIYASAYRLLDVANNMSGYLFAVLLLPIFAKIISEKKELSQIVKMAFNLLFLLSTALAVISIFYGEPLMRLLYNQHTKETIEAYDIRMHQSAKLLLLMMMTFIFTSTTYVFGTLLTANGSLKKLNIIAFCGVCISLILNLLLIPKLQATGSALTSLITQGITALLQVYIAFKILAIKFEKNYIYKIIIYACGILILSWASSLLPFKWFYNITILSILIVSLGFTLKLLNIKTFFHIIQNEK